MAGSSTDWHKTACILCSVNCGIEVRLDGRRIERVRGDKAHPRSQGYTCEKALRLDHYQNGRDRLTSPLRRRADGTFEEIDWDTAIAEIAERLGARARHARRRVDLLLRRRRAGEPPRRRLRRARPASALGIDLHARTRSRRRRPASSGSTVSSSAGRAATPPATTSTPRSRCSSARTRGSRTASRAPARCCKAIANDPDAGARSSSTRAAPRPPSSPTSTSRCARAPTPGVSARCSRCSSRRTSSTATGSARSTPTARRAVATHLRDGADRRVLRVARRRRGGRARRRAAPRAAPSSVSIYEDLGIQQAPYSTLNSYLEKLIYLVTGNFAQARRDEHPLPVRQPRRRWQGRRRPAQRRSAGIASSPASSRARRSPTRSSPIIPIASGRCSSRARTRCTRCPTARACARRSRRSSCVVVIDVAMTETARAAALRAARRVAVREVGGDVLHARVPARTCSSCGAPILDPLPGTLPEPEIHRRLVRALGAYTDDDLAPLHAAAAAGPGRVRRRVPRRRWSSSRISRRSRRWCCTRRSVPTLGEGREGAAAVLWGSRRRALLAYPDSVSVQRARLRRAGDDAVRRDPATPSGVTFTVDDYDETWNRLDTPDGKRQPRASLTCSKSCRRCRRDGRRRRGLPVRALRRRAALVDREHDLPRSVVEEEGRRHRAAHEPARTRTQLGVGDGLARAGRDQARQRRGAGRDHRRDAARAREPAERPRPRLPRRDGDVAMHGVAAERAHRRRRPRLARRHALAQARRGAARTRLT